MADEHNGISGFIAFSLVFCLLLTGLLVFQARLAHVVIDAIFPNYELYPDVLPNEWVVIGRDMAGAEERDARRAQLESIFLQIRSATNDRRSNAASDGKMELHHFLTETDRTHYFINPTIAFLPLYLFIAFSGTFLLSMFFPGTSGISWIRGKVVRAVEQSAWSLRKQCESHDLDFDALSALVPAEREAAIRRSTLPEIVIAEMEDHLSATRWVRGESSNPLTPLKFYFRYRVSTVYANLIQGLVSGGAAILIFVIGLRGLKLIPPEEPSLILMSLSIEFILLVVLMLTFAGSAQEERLDRVVKELEAEQRDAIKQQTDTLRRLLDGKETGNGRAEDDTLSSYEERKILDELLSTMIRASEKKRS